MTEEIMALCRAMGVETDREELLLPLIRAEEKALERRLRRGVSPADCGTAFPLAAAMLAMEGLDRAAGGGQVESFEAGELSIRTRQSGGADSLSGQAERLMAPWLGETGIAFLGVRG